MRLAGRRRGGLMSGLLGLALCAPIGWAADTIFVRPGEPVTITVPIENEAFSGAAIESAQVAVVNPPAVVTNLQVDPAAPVPVGQTKNFTITFVVDPNVQQDGPFTVSLRDIIQDPVDPDPSFYNTELPQRQKSVGLPDLT